MLVVMIIISLVAVDCRFVAGIVQDRTAVFRVFVLPMHKDMYDTCEYFSAYNQ